MQGAPYSEEGRIGVLGKEKIQFALLRLPGFQNRGDAKLWANRQAMDSAKVSLGVREENAQTRGQLMDRANFQRALLSSEAKAAGNGDKTRAEPGKIRCGFSISNDSGSH